MIRSVFFLVLIPVLVFSLPLSGQEGWEEGLEHDEWLSMEKRWIRTQPAIVLLTHSGTQFYGQPVHASMDTLYLYASTGFPVGRYQVSELQAIPFSLMKEVLLQKGGNRVTRSHRAVSLDVNQADRLLDPAFKAIRKGSVYSDSLVWPKELEDAFPHSRVLRQTFPDKHLRVSVGLGFGGNRATGDAEDALGSSQLPDPVGTYYNYRATLDLLDISWRFQDRIVAGGQLFSRRFLSSVYGDSYGVEESTNYQYELNFMEQSIYAEYAFFHVDRYFTRRSEVLAGAGFLMGKPKLSLYYYYNDYTDPENNLYGDIHYTQEDHLYGLQLRGSFQYYLFPGFSLWTGVEVNLYQPWIVDSVELPTSDPDTPIFLQEHSLSFSGARFKFGVSIYL